MHWQAMPWDHFSNLTPEDLEALIVYLQHLPPAWSRVPAPTAAGAGGSGRGHVLLRVQRGVSALAEAPWAASSR